jgi:hypothetical protein
MADAFTVPAFLDLLKTQMQARLAANQDLAAVQVALVPPSFEELPLGDYLYLVAGPIADESKLATANRTRRRDEQVRIPGVVEGYESTRTGGDDAFQPAFARAVEILDELQFELRDNLPQVGGQTRSGIVSNVKWTPAPVDKGGWSVRGDFELTYSSRVP